MISSLNHLLNQREGKLSFYLKNNADILSLEKQHQIYGAIKEIDSIRALLNTQRQKEILSSKKA